MPEEEGAPGEAAMPPARNVVIGQKVDEVKAGRARQLRKALTPEERCLWERLRRNKLEGLHFRRQQVIDGFIVDFYCHAAGVVVEVDGAVHEGQPDYDEARDQALRARSLLVVRLTNDEVNNR